MKYLSSIFFLIFFSCSNAVVDQEQAINNSENTTPKTVIPENELIVTDTNVSAIIESDRHPESNKRIAATNTNFLTFYTRFIKAIQTKDSKQFNELIDANFGVYIVESAGAMPKITKYYTISNYKSATKKSFLALTFKEIQQHPKQEELPHVICDKTPYNKQGCFYQEINPLKESQIWNYAGMNEKEIQAVKTFANAVKITVINTSNYTFYFSFSENQWHIAFIDLRIPCEA